jgi:short-subunit dehydrogenase
LATVLLDVTDNTRIAAAMSTIDASGVRLFGIVNNAGFNLNGAFEFTDESEARAVMETNLVGLAKLSRAALPRLRETARLTGETTKIINIGSIGSLIGVPWEAWYHASKFAVMGISESIHQEVYAQGVRVSVICPGGIKTPFIAKTKDSIRAALHAMPPEGRALYGRGIAGLEDLSAQVDRLGSAPERVARRIAKVLARRNPPFRVIVGPDAAMMNAARVLLPTPWFQAMLRRTFRC